MAPDSLKTIGSLAIHLNDIFPGLPDGVSGNLLIISDMARQHVENFTGRSIGSNSIDATYQSAIVDFAKADVIDLVNAQAGGEQIRLADLSISETGEAMSSQQYRLLAEMKLKTLGRNIQFAKSLS
ncbi:MAG: hypothetical protein IH948_04660 [Bacteroidetes bacterium]|nr:hypothetical protein [Bacteroidota bacterium]